MKPSRHLPLKVLSCALFMLSASATFATELPSSFFSASATTQNPLNFERFDALLQASVLAEGEPSRNTVAPRNNTYEGTRMKAVENIYTALTANRFHFEVYRKSQQMRQMLSQIRQDLSQLPANRPLNSLPRAEQLAYWLNLYNVTVLDEVIKLYPRKDLKSLMLGDNGLLEQKIVRVAGVHLSLNDIQFEILARQFPNEPLVIYGLYQGFIGSPNISARAYTAENVMALLEKNAFEFVNSNRSTLPKGTLGYRVSDFYQRSAAYFPDFQQDLRQHLATYLRAEDQSELAAATTLNANVSDYNVTDIYGTVAGQGLQKEVVIVSKDTAATTPDSNGVSQYFSRAQIVQMTRLKIRGYDLGGKVRVKDLPSSEVTDKPASAI
jgi:hypothetical protein